jgi:hypothetical protein
MTEADGTEHRYEYVLQCPCGARLSGETEDDIVEVSKAHLAELHPDLADSYERHHILFMAVKYRR